MSQSIPERRAAVRDLDDAGESARAIARHLGVSKDTILRDLKTLRRPARASGTPGQLPFDDRPETEPAARAIPETRHAPASPSRAVARRVRPRTRPTRRTGARHTRTGPATAPADAADPAVIEVPCDEWVRRALHWCATAGHPDPVDAIRWALGEAATAIHAAKDTPHGRGAGAVRA